MPSSEIATKQLPPDPEEMNEQRAEWAGAALTTFMEAVYGVEEDTALRDLLCDLMHWCDRHGQDWSEELRIATDHYEWETTDQAPE